MLEKIKRVIKKKYQEDLDTIKVNTGLVLRNENKKINILEKLSDTQFKVFSKFGDDGIISWIFDNLKTEKKIKFIEIGCSNYEECNSKFQLLTKNISVDGYDYNSADINKIKKTYIYQKYDLNLFIEKITEDYIESKFNHYYIKEIDKFDYIISIDIDGNDYWILKKIDIQKLKPLLIIAEYNPTYGFEKKITTTYNENFDRSVFSKSGCLYGVSLQALRELIVKNGYDFLGTNTSGNNAFFVRKDKNLGKKIKKIIYSPASFDECLKITNYDKSKTNKIIENDLKNEDLIKL